MLCKKGVEVEYKMLKYRYAFLLIMATTILFALTACVSNEILYDDEITHDDIFELKDEITQDDEIIYGGEITPEEFIGVWRTEGFAEYAGDFWTTESFSAMYVTNDGNIFFHTTSGGSTAGPLTTTLHAQYEFIGSELMLTPVNLGGNLDNKRYLMEIRITPVQNGLRIETTTGTLCECSACANRDSVHRTRTLYKYSSEVPYGWTYADKIEIYETNERIVEEIFAFAERLSQELGIPVVPYDVNEWRTVDRFLHQHHFPFSIEDHIIEIAFIGEPLLLTRPQRHMRIFEPSFLVMIADEERSVEGQFAFVYDGLIRDLPEEWIDAFKQIDDSIDW